MLVGELRTGYRLNDELLLLRGGLHALHLKFRNTRFSLEKKALENKSYHSDSLRGSQLERHSRGRGSNLDLLPPQLLLQLVDLDLLK